MGFFDSLLGKPNVEARTGVGMDAAREAGDYFSQLAKDQPGAMKALEGALYGMGQAKERLELAPELEAGLMEASRTQARGMFLQQGAASGITGGNRMPVGGMASLMGQARQQGMAAAAQETQSRFQNFLGSVQSVQSASQAFDVKPMVSAAMQGAFQLESSRLGAEAQGDSLLGTIADVGMSAYALSKI